MRWPCGIRVTRPLAVASAGLPIVHGRGKAHIIGTCLHHLLCGMVLSDRINVLVETIIWIHYFLFARHLT